MTTDLKADLAAAVAGLRADIERIATAFGRAA